MGMVQSRPFGELLKRYRLAAGLTQEALADRAGLSPHGISDLERGARRTPRPSTLTLLAEALGLAEEQRTLFFSAAHRPTGEESAAADTGADAHSALETRAAGASTAASRHNLPAQSTPLLGREREVAAVCALLRRDDVRLVTLTGPGGVGKTRLGLRVAEELANTSIDAEGDAEGAAEGVWYVRLARLTDPDQVLPTIAQTLGLREAGSRPIADVLREHLAPRQLLLLLDNFEHLLAAAGAVAALLEESPGLQVLVTSRERLHLSGELEYPVPPLALPDLQQRAAPEHLSQYAAVRLFIQRATAVQPDFQVKEATVSVVAAICARLDGLPLAIELAAARVKVLPPPALLQRLDRRLPLLTGGARDLDERQQTMRNALAWSYDLLSADEQRLFRRLSVFVGGWTLEAAEAVCAAPEGVEPLGLDVLEGLGRLVDHSLLQQREEGGEARFGLLQVIREFALEQLESSDGGNEAEALYQAHVAYFLALAQQSLPHLYGREVGTWLARLEQEYANLRAALSWACARGEQGEREALELGLRLGVAMGPFWFLRRYSREGQHWLERLLTFLDGLPAGPPSSPADAERASRLTATRTWALLFVAVFFSAQENTSRAALLYEEALAAARAAGDIRVTVRALQGLASGDMFQRGDAARGRAFYEEALALARTSGDEYTLQEVLLDFSFGLVCTSGATERAATLAEEGLALARRLGSPYAEIFAGCVLALVASRRGEVARAEALAAEALSLAQQQGVVQFVPLGMWALAFAASQRGQSTRAARLLGAMDAWRVREGAVQAPAEQTMIAEGTAAARTALGEEAWAAAVAAGQALPLEEALAEALEPSSAYRPTSSQL